MTKLYELDRPELLEAKQGILDAAGARPRCSRVTVPVDLTKPWAPALRAAGFDPRAPSVALAQGLTPNLDASSVRHLLEESASLGSPGSRLGIDLVGESVVRSPYLRAAMQARARESSPWQYGTDDPEGLLAVADWKAIVLRAATRVPATGAGRSWCFRAEPRTPRKLPLVRQPQVQHVHDKLVSIWASRTRAKRPDVSRVSAVSHGEPGTFI